jgi:Flp pilus assembly protein TadD
VSPSTKAAVQRAEEREQARKYDEARALYEAAKRDAPDNRSRAYAARELASALIFWGEYEAAETELVEVVELDPLDASAWHDLGVLRARRGDTRRAESALLRAIETAPRDPRPRIALAALMVNDRRFDDALSQYERILDLDLPERTRKAVERGMELIRREMAGTP